jgi:PAS domain S-box-containing protein
VAARILVSGGEPGDRQSLAERLRKAGYRVDGEGTPSLALVIGSGTPPVAGVRTLALVPTGGDLSSRIEEALAQGADGVLPLPVTDPALRREVERHLGLVAARRSAISARRTADALVEIEHILGAGGDLGAVLATAAATLELDTAVVIFDHDPPWMADDKGHGAKPGAWLDAFPEARAAIARDDIVLVGDVSAAGVAATPTRFARAPATGSIVFPVEWRGRAVGALALRRAAARGRLDLDEHEVAFARILAGMLAHVAEASAGPVVPTEITDRTMKVAVIRHDEERRLRAVEKFRAYFEAAADSMVVIDADGKILYVNRAAEGLTGFAREGLVGRPLTDMVPVEQRSAIAQVVAGVLAGSNIDGFDLEMTTTSGDRIWVSLSTSTVLAEHGAAILSFRDVTSERRLETELRKTKDFLEKLIDSTVDAIIAADTDGRIILFNPGAARLFGWPGEEVIGRLAVERLYPAGVAKQIMRMLRSPSYGGVGRLELTRREILTRDGDVVPVNMTASVIYENGREVATVGILSDLRDRIRIEQRLLQAQEKLLITEKQAVVAELAGAAAHELNQPLTSVVLYVEMMLRRMAPDDANLRSVHAIGREAARMAEIVKKIGRITRYETKQYVGGASILDLEKSSEHDSTPPPLPIEASEGGGIRRPSSEAQPSELEPRRRSERTDKNEGNEPPGRR